MQEHAVPAGDTARDSRGSEAAPLAHGASAGHMHSAHAFDRHTPVSNLATSVKLARSQTRRVWRYLGVIEGRMVDLYSR